MNYTSFKKVIVIGSWNVAEGVLRIVERKKKDYLYDILYIDNGDALYSPAGRFADKVGIAHIRETEHDNLTKFFSSITEKSLIISVGNYYLFPKEIVEKEHIVIINFHNAILPNYPGRNAATWAIYMGEKTTGITWHYVSSGIDDGAIINQEFCQIDGDEKAYQLVSDQMKISICGFEKCIDLVLLEKAKVTNQDIESSRKIYYSDEIPQNGLFSIHDNPDKIYRLLRSIDYGKASVFPPAKFIIDGKLREVIRYRICQEDAKANNVISLKFGNGKYLLIRYKNSEEESY
ncbi:formyltransferase family protein [Butyrivibrio sp. LC3010]|uniref:formyltransferase family protein n=1 Tax=Butyrivibrio sp. LC3010 TaxID=1280680 RepID=UPI000411D0F9|nr:formyltransferase family protein [Butyrivibrio sp. LC3010]